MGCVIIAGDFDLSVGSIYGMCAVIVGLLIVNGVNPFLSIFLAVLSGTIVGAINGYLVSVVSIPAFVATLGTMSITRGIALFITKGWPVTFFQKEDIPDWVFYIGGGRVFNIIPMQVVFMVIVLIIGFLILHKSKMGYHIFAVGGNPRAASFYGISVNKVKIFVFAFTGFLSAISGILAMSFIRTAEPNLGTGMELDVIGATIIGGISIKGGEGGVLSVLLGAMTVGILRNGLVLLGVSPFAQKIIIGMILIAAVTLNVKMRKN